MSLRAAFSKAIFALVLTLVGLGSQARAATCTDAACVEIGGRLASIDSNRSYLLNAMLGGLLGSSLNLQVVDWQALNTTQINLLDMLQAIQAQASLGTPEEALDTQVDALKVFTATANALQAKGNTVAANAVLAIAAKLGPGTIRLGDLINACTSCISYADAQLNVLEVVTGMVSLYNYDNMLYTPQPITISGSTLGLASLGTIQLYAQILEKPRIICRTAGSTRFYGAAIRLKLDVTLGSINLNTALAAQVGGLGLSVNVANLQAQLTKVSVYASIARAEGFLQSVDAVGQVVQLQAKPGMVDLYVGQIDDGVFFTHNTTAINVATQLSYATIGGLQFSALGNPITVAVKAKASAIGQAPIGQNLTFAGPFPEQQTVTTSTLFVDSIITTLLNSLDLQLEVTSGLTGLGLLTDTVTTLVNSTLALLKPALIIVYKGALSPILTPLLKSVADPLLRTLGIQIGEAYVTVLGARRRCTYTLSGTVYRDTNRNGFKDGAESGTGLTLYAKLVSEATPTGPASQVVTVDPSTGAFSFSGLSSASYRIVIDDNNTLADVTPLVLATGWVGTEQSTLQRTGIALGSDLPNQNFGLAHVRIISGRVFRDTGTGGGTANDGIRNGGESGIGGVSVSLLDAGGTTLDMTTSAADGAYQLVIADTVSDGTVLRVVESNPANDLSTGASVGNTGGTYHRATDTVTFTLAAGMAYAGVDFGDVPLAQFTADGQQTTLPGSTAYYPHRFVAGSAGSVTFSTSHTLDPVIDGWTELIFLDTNANGQLDAGEPALSGATAVTEGQAINLIVKVYVPTAASYGARNQTIVRADVTYTGANPALTQTVTHTDLTLVGASGTAGLALTKTVDKAAAKPGEAITYTITFVNQSSATLRTIVVSDATPAFTRFVSAGQGIVPSLLGTATIAAPSAGAAGTIRWSFSGELASGATGSVTFIVQIEQ